MSLTTKSTKVLTLKMFIEYFQKDYKELYREVILALVIRNMLYTENLNLHKDIAYLIEGNKELNNLKGRNKGLINKVISLKAELLEVFKVTSSSSSKKLLTKLLDLKLLSNRKDLKYTN